MTVPRSSTRIARGYEVALATVIAFAFGGLVLGMRPQTEPADERTGLDEPSPSAAAPPGLPYTALREHRAAFARVTTDFDLLREALPAIEAPVERDEAALRQAMSTRASRRAFDGAPPTIPHAIDERSSASCLTCHRRGARIGGRTAPAISHEPYANCTQCHVPSVGRPGREARSLSDNAFTGSTPTLHGPRAWLGAPPVIPHSTWMRQECSSCHGVSGRDGIRTTHPERKSCTQCHVPARAATPRM